MSDLLVISKQISKQMALGGPYLVLSDRRTFCLMLAGLDLRTLQEDWHERARTQDIAVRLAGLAGLRQLRRRPRLEGLLTVVIVALAV